MASQTRTTFRAWVTRDCLKTGEIKEIEAYYSPFDTRAVFDSAEDKKSVQNGYWTNEWHKTPQEARDRAEVLREKKIASLSRQLDKLRAMKFTIKED